MNNALPRYNYGSGAGWKTIGDRKRIRGNQTSGKQKTSNCQTNAFKNHMAKCSRSYKDPRYGAWMEKTRI